MSGVNISNEMLASLFFVGPNMPFQSQAQAGWAFATGQPFARRWARQTGPYKRLPYKKRKKSYTLDQLEAFVSSPHYDSATAGAIALGIPELPRLKGEQISPGVTRIRGNLCNVHGKYGPCDKALSGKKPKKGRAARKPRQTPEQRAQAQAQKRQANVDAVAKRMAETDTGLSPSGSKALVAFAQGQQPDAQMGEGLARMGLAERAQDGSYRMTPTGRAAVSAMQAGDYQRAVDAISRGTDAAGAKRGRQAEQAKRQQDAAGKRGAAQMGRELRKRETEAARQRRAAEQAKPKPGSSGDKKKPAAEARPVQRRPRVPTRSGSSAIPSAGGSSSAPKPKPKPVEPKPEKQQPAIASPALTEAAQRLSDGAELSDEDTGALIRNGLARLVKGELVLTATGQRAIRTKEASEPDMLRWEAWRVNSQWKGLPFSDPSDYRSYVTEQVVSYSVPSGGITVFKDAAGAYRWVAISSSTFQDRDREIVSEKALAADCDRADQTGEYGPLRWWHMPGVDIGDCDFNAMHGRTLFEMGTFRNPSIALAAAKSAADLEISLGFFHLPTEPDADGVFHNIRRFERSLVPRGKASNLLTQFNVKEKPPMIDIKEKEAIDKLGSSPEALAYLREVLASAASREKALEDQGVAFKSDEPAAQVEPELPDMIINGITYKAFPPKPAADAPADAAVVVEEDAMEEMPMEEEPAEGGLTLSPEDLAAISEAIGAALQQAVATIMGGLDLEKKVAGHVQSFLAPMQATKDAAEAETAQRLAQLTQQVADLTGDQSAVPYRPSQAKDNVLTDASLLAAVKGAVDPSANPFEDLKRHLIGNGQL